LEIHAEPLGNFKDFFDREIETTHDPEFPEFEYVNPKNDIYQFKKIDENSGVGLALNLSLTESGKYSFFLLKVDHRWKNGSHQIRFGKCSAYNGTWEYRDGRLFLGNDLILEATYRDGLNMLLATFVDAKRPTGAEDIETVLNNGEIDTLLGMSPNADDSFSCGGFIFPIWLPIPSARPW
jgi:hypothetical protein